MGKVYCWDCRNYNANNWQCDSPDNIEVVEKEDYRHRWVETIHNLEPSFMNKDNDCLLYWPKPKRKWWHKLFGIGPHQGCSIGPGR